MGGWMTYQRMRNRNGLAWRPQSGDDSPYPPPEVVERSSSPSWYTAVGDLNRMENGYLCPERPGVGVGSPLEDSPLHEVADATGIDVETVRRVLAFVFRSQV